MSLTHLPKKLFGFSGFTLIELLIVMTIISILTAGVVPAFTTYIKNQTLKQAQEQLKSDMRTIQNRALTGALSDQLIGSLPMKYWAMRFTGGSNVYDYFISADSNSCPASIPAGQFQGNEKFDPKIKVQNLGVGSRGCLFFSVEDGGISVLGFTSGTTAVIIGYSPTDKKQVSFNGTGLIFSTNE